MPSRAVWHPIHPEPADQGDPFVVAVGGQATATFLYYCYVTGEPARDRAFPVYASDDLRSWRALGPVLEAGDVPRAHWAPCVRFVPGLWRPWVMLYSRAQGVGEAAHIGHELRRADAERPEGPFADTGPVRGVHGDFAIDPDAYRAPDGRLWLAWATDFVADAPLGTGIVEAPVSEDLSRVLAPPRLLLRATEDWHLYDPHRRMPWKTIPGIDWRTGTTVRWHTVEAPVGGLVNPAGKRVWLYSGGCYFGFYAVGALVEEPDGRLANVTSGGRHYVVRPEPEQGLFGPGHCAWFRAADGRDFLAIHARLGAPDAPRQAVLLALGWDADGLPVATPAD